MAQDFHQHPDAGPLGTEACCKSPATTVAAGTINARYAIHVQEVLRQRIWRESSAWVLLRIKQRSAGFALWGSCYICSQFFLQFRADIHGAWVPALGLIGIQAHFLANCALCCDYICPSELGNFPHAKSC